MGYGQQAATLFDFDVSGPFTSPPGIWAYLFAAGLLQPILTAWAPRCTAVPKHTLNRFVVHPSLGDWVH